MAKMGEAEGLGRGTAGIASPDLFERSSELALADELLGEAAESRGSSLVLTGAAGIGKTRLLLEIRQRARDLGMTVLNGRGVELETAWSFGVVRELFEPRVARLGPAERAECFAGGAGLAEPLVTGSPDSLVMSADASFASLHGLYWLTANLAADGPLLLEIDDLHWCDGPSLRYLAYLAKRLDGLAVAIVAATRTPEAGPRAELTTGLVAQATASARLEPLSPAGSTQLVRLTTADSPEPEFAAACHRASGGNPYLLHELLLAVNASGLAATDANAQRVPSLVRGSLSDTVLARMRPLSDDCLQLARAVAVIGGNAELGMAATLGGLDSTSASLAADELVRNEILEHGGTTLGFAQPLVGQAVHDDLGPGALARAHSAAARLVARTATEAGPVAVHLLLSEVAADDGWALEMLTRAGRQALAKGDPDAAAEFLRRGLREPSAGPARMELLSLLGRAEALRNRDSDAVEHLGHALELAGEPADFVRLSRELSQLLLLTGDPQRAIAVLDTAIARLSPAEVDRRACLEADAIVAGFVSRDARRAVLSRDSRVNVETDGPGGRLLMAAQSLECLLQDGPAVRAAELAKRALDGGRLLAEEGSDSPAFYMAANTLLYTDELPLADRVYTAAMAEAKDRGSQRGFAMASCWRGGVFLRQGRIADAEADARSSLAARIEGLPIGLAIAVAFLIDALGEQGELDAAEDVLVETGAEAMPGEAATDVLLLESRGRLRVRRGETALGLDDLLACGRLEEAWAFRTPGVTLWRAEAAVAMAILGEDAEARRLADEEVERTRLFAAPRAYGIALRSAALVHRGEQGLELLRSSVEVLEGSQARLEHARSLVDLGAALRRAGLRSKARDCLSGGLSAARACGATALAGHAYDELVLTGSRPRKILRSGVDALTASERRIAAMAAEGMSNRDIAQSLFVTVRTVEGHLGHAYQKLGIGSRTDLAASLDHPPPLDDGG